MKLTLQSEKSYKDSPIERALFYKEILGICVFATETFEMAEELDCFCCDSRFSGMKNIDYLCLAMQALILHIENDEYEASCTMSAYELVLWDLLQTFGDSCEEKVLMETKGTQSKLFGIDYDEFMFEGLNLWDTDFLMAKHISMIAVEKMEFSLLEYNGLFSEIIDYYDQFDAFLEKNGNPIFAIETSELDLPPKSKILKPIEPPAPRYGFVYLMQSGSHPYTKIGFSKKPKAREKTLQGDDPLLHMVHQHEGTMADEKALHERFKKKRVRGEWFNLSIDDIKGIKENAA